MKHHALKCYLPHLSIHYKIVHNIAIAEYPVHNVILSMKHITFVSVSGRNGSESPFVTFNVWDMAPVFARFEH